MRVADSIILSTIIVLSAAQSPSNITCKDGAHIIVARASGEEPGLGRLVTVSDEIISKIPDSDAVAVPYPATITGPVNYFQSEPEGVGNMTELIKQYGDACPSQKMVLMGYSQGAHVIGDVLLGNAYGGFPITQGIDMKYIDQIAAVVLMGDPANAANQSILVGNSTRNGTFTRTNTDLWVTRGLANRTVSYCDAGDTYCDSGIEGRAVGSRVHNGYVPEYGAQAAQFVEEKFAYAKSTNSSGGSAGPTSSSPGSTTATTSPTMTSSGSGAAATTSMPPNSASGLSLSTSWMIVMCSLAFAATTLL